MLLGLHENLSNNDYHGGAGVSKSMLDVIRSRSPMHLHHARTSKEQAESTPAQIIGSAAHTAILEPEFFEDRYVVSPKFDRRTKDGKAQSAEFEALHSGKICLDKETWDDVIAMRDSVLAHPVAGKLFNGKGKAEYSMYWNDDETGELCRCRPDYWRDDINAIVDLKTTEDAGLEAFSKSIMNYRYHVQHAFYQDGANKVFADNNLPFNEIKNFIFVAVEKKAPYAVCVYVLDEVSVELGRAAYKSDLAKYAECNTGNNWPGYGNKIQNIGLPAWYVARHSL